MRLRLLPGKRVEESKLRVNGLPFVPQQTLNSITTTAFITSDSTHGSKTSLMFENYNKSNLDPSQDSGDSPVLNYNRTQLHSPQGSEVVDRLCPESSTDSNAFIGSKLATLDDTPAGINRSRPNLKDLCDNGCVIPPLHESGHFASTGTVMRDSYSVESPLEVDERISNVVRLPESSDMADVNSGRHLLPKLEGGVGIASESQPSSSREVVDLSEVLSTRDSCSEPDITSRPYLDIEVGGAKFHSLVDTGSTKTFLGSLNVPFISSGECKVDRSRSSIVLMANGNIESMLGTALLPVTFNGVTHLMTVRILLGLNDSCILGTDFVTQFGLVIDGKVRQLWLADEPIIKFAFDSKFRDDPDTCRGIALLSETERHKLEVFLGRVKKANQRLL